MTRLRFGHSFWLIIGFIFLTCQSSPAQERLCDPSFENCYAQILDLVRKETVGIDMAFYMIELPGLTDEVIARHNAGVPVRLIVEPRGNLKFPMNQPLLDKFKAAGIPMRYKLGDGIIHIKEMLLRVKTKSSSRVRTSVMRTSRLMHRTTIMSMVHGTSAMTRQ